MTLLPDQGPERGYFPEQDKSLFVYDSSTQEETENQKFEAEGLEVNMVPGSRYLDT